MTRGLQSVSIIIRTYNESQHIGSLLEEIRKQDFQGDVEVLVVDSGSTDQTVDIAKKAGTKVLHLEKSEFSFGRSLNIGIQSASHEICIIVSAHCHPVGEQWLRAMVSPFDRVEVGMVYGRQCGVKQSKYSERKLFESQYPETDQEVCETPFANNANSAVRKSIWERHPFDEDLTGLEDLDFARNAIEKGYCLAYSASASVYHVHEETWRQIYQRYYREAFAYCQIYKEHRFSFLDFLKLAMLNSGVDATNALFEFQFFRNIFGILMFRWIQFYATYRATQDAHRTFHLSHRIRQQLYYPKLPKPIARFRRRNWIRAQPDA